MDVKHETICFMLVWWGAWITGGSILVSNGSLLFRNWISTSCVTSGGKVVQAGGGKTRTYACDLSVTYADGVTGTVRQNLRVFVILMSMAQHSRVFTRANTLRTATSLKRLV